MQITSEAFTKPTSSQSSLT